jgi:hypothetical protein
MTKDLVPVPAGPNEPVPIGNEIEVIVRYAGKEWMVGSGTVEEVGYENELREKPLHGVYREYEATGRQWLKITLMRHRKEIAP